MRSDRKFPFTIEEISRKSGTSRKFLKRRHEGPTELETSREMELELKSGTILQDIEGGLTIETSWFGYERISIHRR